ncbi:hypothetical protein JRQ81_003336 [Phrynocephalus forsythii]|uniref:Ig-like domain-containing protein n=1 Tax=Phrynocephalus forsythii TaxID=171643 RepID=A0A9Q1AXC4_9SAUR|nr:hypothetical protein JRQ81_003336 [Phrynocephalus forsythii]
MVHLFLCFLVAWSAVGVEKGAAEENFLSIQPERPVVEYGASVVLNCSSSCSPIHLEASLKWAEVGSGPTWKAFNITEVNQWAATPLCYANCGDESMKDRRANFTVYRAPQLVKLDPLQKMEVGKEYNLTCQVFDVAPIRNLTVTLFKGEKPLLVKTFENHNKPKPGHVLVIHPIALEREDQDEEVTCHAALDLRPEGPLLENTSSNESLELVDFQKDPVLRSPFLAETLSQMTVACDVSGVFPAKEATFELSFSGNKLDPVVTVLGESASAQALVVPTSAGNHELICTVSLGPVTRSANNTVNVYTLPKPILEFDPLNSLVNTTVNVTCKLNVSESPGVVMEIKDNRGILVSSEANSSVIQLNVTTQEEDDGREFVCEVQLSVGGITIMKNTSAKLTVLYGPRINDASCPSMLTWKEGSMETFACSASGNPSPTVECRKDNVPFHIGVQQEVNREHQGVYHCGAHNTYGSDAKDVTVVVEYFQLNVLALSLSVLGAVVLISVAAVGYYMYYRSHKMRMYRLKQQAAGNPMERNCLNANGVV